LPQSATECFAGPRKPHNWLDRPFDITHRIGGRFVLPGTLSPPLREGQKAAKLARMILVDSATDAVEAQAP